jgi:hypothetical protein
MKPLKMNLTEGSETSAQLILTPGKYPKESIQKTHYLFLLDSFDLFKESFHGVLIYLSYFSKL